MACGCDREAKATTKNARFSCLLPPSRAVKICSTGAGWIRVRSPRIPGHRGRTSSDRGRLVDHGHGQHRAVSGEFVEDLAGAYQVRGSHDAGWGGVPTDHNSWGELASAARWFWLFDEYLTSPDPVDVCAAGFGDWGPAARIQSIDRSVEPP